MLVAYTNGVTVEEAFKRAEGRRILSNKEVDKLLATDKWGEIREAFPCWTGTMTAYEEPGKKLGKTVEYEDGGKTWVFPVPVRYQGEKDAILVVEHPHFTIKADGNRRTIVADEAHVSLVENFPAKNGWYDTDAKTGIPFGEESSSDSEDTRYLYRYDKRVGSVARDFDDFDGRRGVVLDGGPSRCLGVVVEGKASEAGAL